MLESLVTWWTQSLNIHNGVYHKLETDKALPVLDYACIVWDPHLKKDCLLIENIQLFAARMATKSWRANASTLNETLNLPPIASRRAYISKYFMPSSF